jgi:tRNA(fMet)-specific endonuclease VapC
LTPITSAFWNGRGDEYVQLQSRLKQLDPQEISTTIVSYEEQTRGWLAFMARARKVSQLIEAYRRLHRHLDVYRAIQVLDFDEMAAIEFQHLQYLRGRIGSADTRIAAIVLSRNATLLTRNSIHFEQVPGLQIADWTAPTK